jgi:hypothetical protein
VPTLEHGRFTLAALEHLLATRTSRYREGPIEGIVIRRDAADWCEARAKLVQADFTQDMVDHWRRRAIQRNQLAGRD